MNPELRIKLAAYIYKITYSGKTIDNMIQELMRDQEAQIEKDRKADKDGLKFYEDLLKVLKPVKTPSIKYEGIDGEILSMPDKK